MTKDSQFPPFMEESMNSFKQFKFPGMDVESLMKMYQKNVELMNSTQEIASETTRSLMELQQRYIQKALDQWNDHMKVCTSKAPLAEKTSHHTEATKNVVDQTLEHIQKMNAIITKSNEKLNESFQKSFKEGFDESVNMTKKAKEK